MTKIWWNYEIKLCPFSIHPLQDHQRNKYEINHKISLGLTLVVVGWSIDARMNTVGPRDAHLRWYFKTLKVETIVSI